MPSSPHQVMTCTYVSRTNGRWCPCLGNSQKPFRRSMPRQWDPSPEATALPQGGRGGHQRLPLSPRCQSPDGQGPGCNPAGCAQLCLAGAERQRAPGSWAVSRPHNQAGGGGRGRGSGLTHIPALTHPDTSAHTTLTHLLSHSDTCTCSHIHSLTHVLTHGPTIPTEHTCSHTHLLSYMCSLSLTHIRAHTCSSNAHHTHHT